jgi:hypothetical protein
MLQRQFIQKVAENARYDLWTGELECGLCHDFYMQLFSLKIWEITLASQLLPLAAKRSADRSSSTLRMFVQSFKESVRRNH